MSVDPSIQESLQSVEKPVILIVDDSRVIRLALKKILKKEFILHEAGDGEEAWAALLEDPTIQVVFSDLSMPELDGFGLLDRIRNAEDERISKLPFIVITGNEDDEGILKRALDGGANDLITKPFQSREIKERAYAFAKTQAASEEDLGTDSALTGVSTESTDNMTSQDQVLNEEKQLAIEAEREAARLKEEEEIRRKAVEEAAARIKEEVEERRRKMELEEESLLQEEQDQAAQIVHEVETAEETIELIEVEEPVELELAPEPEFPDLATEALRKIEIVEEEERIEAAKCEDSLEVPKKNESVVEKKISEEVEARKKAEEELARLKQQMEEQKGKERLPLELRIEENTCQQTGVESGLLEESEKDEHESVIASDVRKTDDHIKKTVQTGNLDERQNMEETEIIRAELRKKLQIEHEQKKQASGLFFIRIFVLFLGIINMLPGIRLDDKINNLKKRISG